MPRPIVIFEHEPSYPNAVSANDGTIGGRAIERMLGYSAGRSPLGAPHT